MLRCTGVGSAGLSQRSGLKAVEPDLGKLGGRGFTGKIEEGHRTDGSLENQAST